jgi:TRAP-type C4-dicarboxylate transport system substrate-binding protein
MKNINKAAAAICLLATVSYGAQAAELSLAYFMGPKHPMNKGVFTPFGDKLKELSGGALTVKQFAGGALNKVPPKQYSILVDGVSDIAFTLPGYTADVFPKTNVVSLPGVCDSAVACTESLQRARAELEPEYNAKVLALWANAPAVLITKSKPVRTLQDLKGMKVRVTSKADAAFVEALGASAVAQPVSVINQNLANGVIDAIMIDPSAIRSFKLHEVAKHVTTWFPGSGSPFALLMNKETYNDLSATEKGWVDGASSAELSMNAGRAYMAAAAGGLKLAADSGLEMIELPASEKAQIEALVDEAMVIIVKNEAGDKTISEMIKILQGK